MERLIDYLRGWNFMRVFQLVIGIFILIDGLGRADWFIAAFGLFFLSMPVFNVGCCAGRACNTPMRNSGDAQEELVYEEIKEEN